MLTSLILLTLGSSFPDLTIYKRLADFVSRFDFQQTILQGMLGYLLFAGALHIDVSTIESRAFSGVLMATLGVLISTAVIGCGLWWLARMLGADLPLGWAVVFGSSGRTGPRLTVAPSPVPPCSRRIVRSSGGA